MLEPRVGFSRWKPSPRESQRQRLDGFLAVHSALGGGNMSKANCGVFSGHRFWDGFSDQFRLETRVSALRNRVSQIRRFVTRNSESRIADTCTRV